jgi:hypothetical protein|tara:strand:- start:98 stop:670 length:573 start_codon:yes stop_codon:yes gene_type:complete
MFYLYALLLIVSGLAVAWFGQKKYGLSFALTYLVTSFVSYLMIYSEAGEYPFFSIFLGITLAITLGIWFFSKAFTYLIAWELICLIILLPLIKISDGEPNPILGLIAIVLPIAIVYYFRKVITKITLGFFSGFNIAFGLLSIILLEKFKSGAIFTEQPTYVLIILLLCLAGGVYFQFSPFANNKTTTKDS